MLGLMISFLEGIRDKAVNVSGKINVVISYLKVGVEKPIERRNSGDMAKLVFDKPTGPPPLHYVILWGLLSFGQILFLKRQVAIQIFHTTVS